MGINKLILGTVQFGLDYGINNTSGKIPSAQVSSILNSAYEKGVRILDTAEGYGNSQEILGPHSSKFEVMSKFSAGKLGQLSLQQNLEQSLQVLNKSSLLCYSFHVYNDTEKSFIVQDIQELKRNGLIRNIGVTLYSNEQFEDAISKDWIDFIQIPFNLLDNYSKRGRLIELAKQRGKTVHVRSVFLQGLFFKDPGLLPEKLSILSTYLKQLHGLCQSEKIDLNRAALLYPFAFPDIDGVLFGVDNLEQLNSNLSEFEHALSRDFIANVTEIRVLEEKLLQPINW